MSVAAGDPTLRGNRPFLLLWSGAGVSYLGSEVSVTAYALVVLWATGSAATAGLVAVAAQLPMLLVQLPAGLIADRFDRRRLMLVCDLVRLVAIATVAVALLNGWFSIVHLVVVALIEGSFTVVYRVTEVAALPSVVPDSLLPTATARNEARGMAAGIIGQPTAGVLATLAQWAPFLFTSIAHAFSLGTLLLIKQPLQQARSRDADERILTELTAGLTWLWRQHFARAAIGLLAVSNLLFEVLLLGALVSIRDGGGTEATASLVSGIAAVGGLLGALSAPWWLRRVSLPVLVIGANAAWTCLVPLMAVVSGPLALGSVLGVATFIGAGWTVAVITYLIQTVPDELRGRVTSVGSLIAFGPAALGPLLGGISLDRVGVGTTVLGVALIMLVLTVVAAASRAIRNPPVAPDESVSTSHDERTEP